MDVKKVLYGIREELAEHSYRLTPQREAVVKSLIENKQNHLSAEDIYISTKELWPDIGLATVYRTLEVLEKLSIVHKLEYGDGQSRYELNLHDEEHYHHHLICLQCGKISEFNDDLLEEIEERIATETEFKVTDHCLRFFGVCKECRGK